MHGARALPPNRRCLGLIVTVNGVPSFQLILLCAFFDQFHSAEDRGLFCGAGEIQLQCFADLHASELLHHAAIVAAGLAPDVEMIEYLSALHAHQEDSLAGLYAAQLF
jgi:hypothetical protein